MGDCLPESIATSIRERIIELYPGRGPRAWRRRGLLALVGVAHVTAFIAIRSPALPVVAPVAAHAPITYILSPFKLAPPRVAAQPVRPRASAPLTMPAPRARRDQPDQRDTAPVDSAAPQAITQVPSNAQPPLQTTPPDPFAPPPPNPGAAPDLRQRALQSAAAADRQMRKEAWNPRDKKIANDTTALAAAIGSAYRGGGNTYEQVTTADGRVMTKVHTPGGGTYCAVKESNATTGGRDPFRDGIKTKFTTC